jgi:hypothetical protein
MNRNKSFTVRHPLFGATIRSELDVTTLHETYLEQFNRQTVFYRQNHPIRAFSPEHVRRCNCLSV